MGLEEKLWKDRDRWKEQAQILKIQSAALYSDLHDMCTSSQTPCYTCTTKRDWFKPIEGQKQCKGCGLDTNFAKWRWRGFTQDLRNKKGTKAMHVMIDGTRFPEEDFDVALEVIRGIDPVMATALEGVVQWVDDEDSKEE